ncbi:YihY/virulence factor BrkB family protein [Streptomyces lateritius]|uniref:YihY/virulence factor BrkB family protein n=1 Tax=Streptomyces lateritius TaxID=67313 RepID=UPI001679EC2F|nr:YihY/virulence factor BrkB family protein [Streptomyces lateritius]
MTTPRSHPAGRAAFRARIARSTRRWWPALRATPVSMWRDDVADWAAALTYYAILALVPALLVAVTLTGLVSPEATERLISHVASWAPAESGGTLGETLRGLAQEQTAAWMLIVAGSVSALWSASSYLAVFRRALHAMHRVKDQRPALHTAPIILLNAALLLVLLVTSAGVVVVTEPLARLLGAWLRWDTASGPAWASAWALVKWVGLVGLVTMLVLVLFRTGPASARARAHAVPGATLAVLLWLAGSAAFALYATSLGTYSRLYGSLAGVIVFLVWLWSAHLSLLAGAQFTAELSLACEGGLGEAGGSASPPSPDGGRRRTDRPHDHEQGSEQMTENMWAYSDTSGHAAGVVLSGYKVEALDGSIGKVDKHSDEAGSAWLVVDTGVWIFGKEVLLPAGTITRIEPDERVVHVNRTKEQIKNAPEFVRERHLEDTDYHRMLGGYYSGPLM